jgi:hypothetical protein
MFPICPVARGWRRGQPSAAAMWAHVDECAVCQERLLRGLGQALLQPPLAAPHRRAVHGNRERIDALTARRTVPARRKKRRTRGSLGGSW